MTNLEKLGERIKELSKIKKGMPFIKGNETELTYVEEDNYIMLSGDGIFHQFWEEDLDELKIEIEEFYDEYSFLLE